MRKILTYIVGIFIIIFAFSMLRDIAAGAVVTVVASQVTGAPVRMGRFSMSLMRQTVEIRGLRVYNPSGFPKGILVAMPKVHVKYDLLALLNSKLRFPLVDIELSELGLIRNKEGKLNVDALKVVKEQDKGNKTMLMRLDIVNLYIGKVVSKDYSAETPVVKVYDIHINKTYRNITSVQQLMFLTLSEPMKAAGIKGAMIYGVAALSGIAILPVAVGALVISKDSITEEISVPSGKLYDLALSVLKQAGKVNIQDPAAGVISALVDGASVSVKLKKISELKTRITVSARKYMLPRREVASGVLYQITEKLK